MATINSLLKKGIQSTIFKTVNLIFRQLSDTPFLIYKVHMRAVEDSVDYIEENMQRAMHFNFREDFWNYAFGQRKVEGLILEFGVWQAFSTNFFAKLAPNERVYGFDSFEGLQEDWAGNDRPKGYFSLGGKLPKVRDNVTLVKGFFNDSLPEFLRVQRNTPVSFIHFDADTYEATRTVFNLLQGRLMDGTVVIFDEYLGYRGWRLGEWKAWQEFVKENGIEYQYLAFSEKQVAIKIARR
jgi:hypothetical protein